MKQIKTLFFVLLTLALVMALGVFAAAETGDAPAATVVETGDCGAEGSDVQYQLYDNGTLVISGAGKIQYSFFSDRMDILEVTIENGVTGADYYAFNHCEHLESVSLPKTFQTGIGDNFYYCPALKRFIVDPESPYLTADARGCLYSKDMTALIKYPAGTEATAYRIPDTVTTICASAFNYCAALETITIPDSVTEIQAQAFDYCTALENVSIPTGVTTFDISVFSGCSSLQQIIIPDSFTEIPSYTFSGCSSLTSVEIPENVTKIGNLAFASSGLETIDLHDGITEIGIGAFGGCKSLKHIALPKYITEIKTGTFVNDTALERITIPSGVRTIGKQAFGEVGMFGCEALSDVYVMMDEATWNRNVTVAEKNDCLLNATLHFLPADSDWIRLPYTADGLSDGDWYLDMDAFMDAIGRGKSDEEKAEVRALIEQHVVFSYNPGGEQCVYKYDFTDLPGEDGTPVSGTVILPLDLTLGSDDAFPYDYNALQQCVRQYHTPTAPDTPQQPADDDDDSGNWFDQHIIRPLRSAIATILSFFRRLFGKKR